MTGEPETRDPAPLHLVRLDLGVEGLPRPTTSFLGRQGEVAAVVSMLDGSDLRLVTLTGPGGVGKTRIAIEAAARLDREFPDGIAFISFASTTDPSRVPVLVAQATGVPDVTGQSLSQRLEEHLRNRSMLLVLDNLEHLSGIETHIADLLSETSRLKVLGTSRRRLGLSGEQVYPVPPMAAHEAADLFRQRARSIEPEAGSASDEVVVGRICERLDCLPLAIELAAARVDVLPPPALLEQLEHKLAILVGGPRDAPARQQTMRKAIQWSHDLLAPEEQVLFRRLAVFDGGFSLDAARAMLPDPSEGLARLSALVAHSLVRPMPGPAGDPRFRLPSTIREFAWEQLANHAEIDEIRSRHAAFYLELTEAALPRYDGPELPLYKDRTEAELDNSRAAMSWSLESGDWPTAIRLAGALWRIWWPGHAIGGKAWTERIREGLTWIERALEHRKGLPVEIVGEALIGGGAISSMLEDFPATLAYAEELLRLSEAQDYPYGAFWACFQLGNAAIDGGVWHETTDDLPQEKLDAAQTWMERAHDVASRARNPENHAAMALGCLSDIAKAAGDDALALQHAKAGLALARQCGNPHCISWIGLIAGRLHLKHGDHASAIRDLLDSTDAYRANTDHSGLRAAVTELARVALALGEPGTAADLLASAQELPAHEHDRPIHDEAVAQTLRRLGEKDWEARRAAPPSLDAVLALACELNSKTAAIPENVPAALAGLTPREVDVLALLVEGRSNREMADRLSISQRTVENHVQHILGKLGVDSRTAAATWAIRKGIG